MTDTRPAPAGTTAVVSCARDGCDETFVPRAKRQGRTARRFCSVSCQQAAFRAANPSYSRDWARNNPEARRALNAANSRRRIAKGLAHPELIPHGTAGYDHWGCRCLICRTANSDASREYRSRRLA